MSGFDWEQVAAAIGRTGSMYREYMEGLAERPVAPTVDRAMLRERYPYDLPDDVSPLLRVVTVGDRDW